MLGRGCHALLQVWPRGHALQARVACHGKAALDHVVAEGLAGVALVEAHKAVTADPVRDKRPAGGAHHGVCDKLEGGAGPVGGGGNYLPQDEGAGKGWHLDDNIKITRMNRPSLMEEGTSTQALLLASARGGSLFFYNFLK